MLFSSFFYTFLHLFVYFSFHSFVSRETVTILPYKLSVYALL